jgi:hypothetical protein
MYDAKHPAFGLWPSFRLIEANAMYGRDRIVIEGAESREHDWDAFGLTDVLVPPWTAWMKAQHGTG